jgi:hypothetical protein
VNRVRTGVVCVSVEGNRYESAICQVREREKSGVAAVAVWSNRRARLETSTGDKR